MRFLLWACFNYTVLGPYAALRLARGSPGSTLTFTRNVWDQQWCFSRGASQYIHVACGQWQEIIIGDVFQTFRGLFLRILGGDMSPGSGRARTYPEGRLGYEQYAAVGFSLWSMNASRSLVFHPDARPTSFHGVGVWSDSRAGDFPRASHMFLWILRWAGQPGNGRISRVPFTLRKLQRLAPLVLW